MKFRVLLFFPRLFVFEARRGAAGVSAWLLVLCGLLSGDGFAQGISPEAGAVVFNVRAFGAAADGRTLDTDAINRAITAAHDAGGGTVFFPAGTYLSVSIRLQSHVTLHLGPGAVLEAAAHTVKTYDEPEPGNDEGQKYSSFGHSHWRNSLLWGIDLENVAIVGPGRIAGYGLFRDNVVPAGAANKAIALKDCRKVLLRDFTILQGGHFAILASGVDNLTLDNLTIDTNRDGIDVDGCRDVRIANCRINSPFDDAICLKSSFGTGAVRMTENVTIANCQVSGYDMGTLLDGTRQRNVDFSQPMPTGVTGRVKFGPLPETVAKQSGPTGRIKLGTESNGGFVNVTITNCTFDYCRGLALELVDGGRLENVVVTNLVMRDVTNAPLFLRLGNRARGPGKPGVGVFRRVMISNVVAVNSDSRYGCIISGIPGHEIEDVVLENLHFSFRGGGTEADALRVAGEHENEYPEPHTFGVMPAYAFFVRHVRGLSMRNVKAYALAEDRRPPMILDDVRDAFLQRLDLEASDGVPRIVAKAVAEVRLVDSKGTTDVGWTQLTSTTLPAIP